MVNATSAGSSRALAILATLIVAAAACSRDKQEQAPPAATAAAPARGAAAPVVVGTARGETPPIVIHRQTPADPVDYWVEQLGWADPAARLAAARALGLSGATTEAAVTGLTDLLDDGDPAVRREAAAALARIGAPASAASAKLETMQAGDDDAAVRQAAGEALAAVRATGAAVPAAPSEPLPPPPPATEPAAQPVPGAVLAGRGPFALNDLQRGARSSDPLARAQAIAQLGQLGPSAAPAVGDILRALRSDSSADVRREAAVALGTIGGRGYSPAPPPLIHSVVPSRQPTPMSLGLQGQQALRALGDALADDDPAVRRAAAEALGRIGPPARDQLRDLEGLAQDDDDAAVRAAANSAIAAIGRP